ncbi:hypothetical protein GGF31_000219 [Allomyces arbusculus]|nr:hypothetical protein GGF31_000219 [Allomyces arbusculus]
MALPTPTRGPPPAAAAARPAPPRLGLAIPSRRLNAAPPASRTDAHVQRTSAAIPVPAVSALARSARIAQKTNGIDLVEAVLAAAREIQCARGIVRFPRDCNFWVDNHAKREVLTAARAAALAEADVEVQDEGRSCRNAASRGRSTAEVRPAAAETRTTAAAAAFAAATKSTGIHRAGALARPSVDAGPTAKPRATAAAAAAATARAEPSKTLAKRDAAVPRKVSVPPAPPRLRSSAAAPSASVSATTKPVVLPERARKLTTPAQLDTRPGPAPPTRKAADLMSPASSNARALAILDAKRTDAPAVAPTPARAPPPPTTADVTRARLIKRAQSLPAPAPALHRRPASAASAESQPVPSEFDRAIERPSTSPLLGRWEVVVKVGNSPKLAARGVGADRARTASGDRTRTPIADRSRTTSLDRARDATVDRLRTETAERTRPMPSAAPSVPLVPTNTAPQIDVIPAAVRIEVQNGDEAMDEDVPLPKSQQQQAEEASVRISRKRARPSHGDSQESAGMGPTKRLRQQSDLPARPVVPERQLPSPDILHATVVPTVSPPKSPPRPASPPSSPRAAGGAGADVQAVSVSDPPPVEESAPAPPPVTAHVSPPQHRFATKLAPDPPSSRPLAVDLLPAKGSVPSPPPPPTNLVSPPQRRSMTDPTQTDAQALLAASPAPIGLGIATSPLVPRFSALNVAPKSGSPIASPENAGVVPSKPAPPFWAIPSRAPPSGASWLIPAPPAFPVPPPPPPPAFPPPPATMSHSSIARPRWSLGGASSVAAAAPTSPAPATAWWKRTPSGGTADPTTPSNRRKSLLGISKTTTPRRDPVREERGEEEEHERDVSVFAYSESQRGLDRSVMDLERMLTADVDLLAGVNAAGSQESVDGSVTEGTLDLLGKMW